VAVAMWAEAVAMWAAVRVLARIPVLTR
jgi:hypothetical protein